MRGALLVLMAVEPVAQDRPRQIDGVRVARGGGVFERDGLIERQADVEPRHQW